MSPYSHPPNNVIVSDMQCFSFPILPDVYNGRRLLAVLDGLGLRGHRDLCLRLRRRRHRRLHRLGLRRQGTGKEMGTMSTYSLYLYLLQ